MTLLVVLPPARFRDEELFEPEAVFREAGITVDRASLRKGHCSGMLGGSADARLDLAGVEARNYEGLVIVGGSGSPEFLWESKLLQALVLEFATLKRPIGAICLSPVVLARAGVLFGKKATVYPTPQSIGEMVKGGAVLVEDDVVIDGNIITGNGPAASRAFARAVVTVIRS
jgi:protease I